MKFKHPEQAMRAAFNGNLHCNRCKSYRQNLDRWCDTRAMGESPDTKICELFEYENDRDEVQTSS